MLSKSYWFPRRLGQQVVSVERRGRGGRYLGDKKGGGVGVILISTLR